MNQRHHWDHQRGITSISLSPNARDIPTPDEVKRWINEGAMPYTEEPDRCPSCGRSEKCACGKDCQFCEGGIPDPDLWSPMERARAGLSDDPTDDVLRGTE